MRCLKNFAFWVVILIFDFWILDLSYATPTTHIWAPSTDVQAYGTGHITADIYIPVNRNSDGTRPNAITNTGLTFGILPFKKLNAEAGFDYKTGLGDLDSYPIYFNAKVGVPENTFKDDFAYGKYLPAVAFGIYDVGTRADKTDNNVVYGKAAKTLSLNDISFGALESDFSLGRFSVGYFLGNDKLLLNKEGDKDQHGMLWAWERTMTEISDKLWLCVEYQGSNSAYGALNVGASWKFTPSTSVIVGYEFYNNHDLANTATIQVDVDF